VFYPYHNFIKIGQIDKYCQSFFPYNLIVEVAISAPVNFVEVDHYCFSPAQRLPGGVTIFARVQIGGTVILYLAFAVFPTFFSHNNPLLTLLP